MRKLALVALSIGALGLMACGDDGGSAVDSGPVVFADAGNGADAAVVGAECNPVNNTGCGPSEKCTWVGIVDTNLGNTTCAPDGTVVLGGTCALVAGEQYDDCAGGAYCINGACQKICDTTDSVGTCPTDFNCGGWADLFNDSPDTGTCSAACDPVTQNCPGAEACYLQATTGEASCVGVPASAATQLQDDMCYGPAADQCYVNGCAKGYGSNIPDGRCAFFCSTIDNYVGSVGGLQGDPAGVRCVTDFQGARPDGPGPSYHCKYIQSFYSNTDLTPEHVGMCLNPTEFGDCGNFDWVALQAAINGGTTIDQAYCDTNPNHCMGECISIATFDAAFPSAAVGSGKKVQYNDILSPKFKKMVEARMKK